MLIRKTVSHTRVMVKSRIAALSLPVAALLLAGHWTAAAQPSESTGSPLPVGKLMIFHAGSLSAPFKEIAARFQKEYPRLKFSEKRPAVWRAREKSPNSAFPAARFLEEGHD